MPRLLARVSVALAASAFLLIGLELVARVGFPLQEFEAPRLVLVHRGVEVPVNSQQGLKLPSEVPGFRTVFKPNLEFRWCYDVRHGFRRSYMDERGCVSAHTNANGLRGDVVAKEKAPGRFRVACLGDSFTFGHGVPDGGPWVAGLQASLQGLLDQRGSELACETINFGISGFSARDVAHLCETEVLSYRPDLVVYAFFLNDVFLQEGSDERGAAVLRYQETLYGPRSGLARWSEIARRVELALARKRYYSTTSYPQAFAPDSSHWRACQAELTRMHTLCSEAGTRLFVVIFPDLVDETSYPYAGVHAIIAAFLREQGIPFSDLAPDFAGLRSPELWVHPTDHHPNEVAHALAARSIAAALEPWLP